MPAAGQLGSGQTEEWPHRDVVDVPGVFAFIGNGEASPALHNPTDDFNDAALLHGMRLHAAIVRNRLPPVTPA